MYLSIILLLQETAGKKANTTSSLLFFAVLIIIFYFFMIRPQMKKQKDLRNYRENLKKGDKVVTTGGIYGRILEIKDNTAMIEIDSDVKIKVDRGSIVRGAEDLADQQKK